MDFSARWVWGWRAFCCTLDMTGVLPWMICALLLMASIGPAMAQTSPDESGAPNAVAPQPRSDFPYGVRLADIGNAPRAAEAGFRVMASTVSWRRTEPSG